MVVVIVLVRFGWVLYGYNLIGFRFGFVFRIFYYLFYIYIWVIWRAALKFIGYGFWISGGWGSMEKYFLLVLWVDCLEIFY